MTSSERNWFDRWRVWPRLITIGAFLFLWQMWQWYALLDNPTEWQNVIPASIAAGLVGLLEVYARER